MRWRRPPPGGWSTIGARIREARRAADLSQVTLGERFRDHKTIHRQEYAERAPFSDLLHLADALHTSLADRVR
ncbi:hypothetical protein GCM10027074_33620 [Streptomyces deserti]